MEYSISAIPVIGGFGSSANDINNDGMSVGQSNGTTFQHAVSFKDNVLTDLTPDKSINFSEAHGVNTQQKHQIVGEYRQNSATKAFLWQDGMFTDLHSKLNASWSIAKDINNNGIIVGTGGGSNAETFIFNSNDNSLEVPYPDTQISFGHAINVHGHIVGRGFDLPQGFYYDTEIHLLGTLGGNASDPQDINDSNMIVGAAKTTQQKWHAVLYQGNSIQDIDSFSSAYSRANGINNNGSIVGEVNIGNGTEAFIRKPNQPMELLLSKVKNKAGWSEMWRANAINDEGQICGTGVFNGEYHGFVLTPIVKNDWERFNPNLKELVAEILFGVGTGGGGVIIVGGKPIPVDPPLPFKTLIERHRRPLSDLIIRNLGRIEKPEERIEHIIEDTYNELRSNYNDFFRSSR